MAAWEFVAQDRSEVLVNLVALECHGNPPDLYVKLKGLEQAALYQDESSGSVYPGGALMTAGLPIPRPTVEYESWQIHLRRALLYFANCSPFWEGSLLCRSIRFITAAVFLVGFLCRSNC